MQKLRKQTSDTKSYSTQIMANVIAAQRKCFSKAKVEKSSKQLLFLLLYSNMFNTYYKNILHFKKNCYVKFTINKHVVYSKEQMVILYRNIYGMSELFFFHALWLWGMT